MKIIVGLGNPGEKYENSRHNTGFMVADELLRNLMPVEKALWKESKKFSALMARLPDLFLAKPQTFMNASGFAVAKIASFYKIRPSDIWVIHDDLDLSLGKVKIRKKGGFGGHRGVKSVIEQLGTDELVRFRIGIGHPGLGSSKDEVEKYVLASFCSGEKSKIKKAIKKTTKAVEMALQEGLERAMNKFNMK